jgi:hypothetical protein
MSQDSMKAAIQNVISEMMDSRYGWAAIRRDES